MLMHTLSMARTSITTLANAHDQRQISSERGIVRNDVLRRQGRQRPSDQPDQRVPSTTWMPMVLRTRSQEARRVRTGSAVTGDFPNVRIRRRGPEPGWTRH